jgi:hypothetical protein
MSDPVREIGHVAAADGGTLRVGVDHGNVTIGRPLAAVWALTAADRDLFSRLYFDAEAEAEKWQQDNEEAGHV